MKTTILVAIVAIVAMSASASASSSSMMAPFGKDSSGNGNGNGNDVAYWSQVCLEPPIGCGWSKMYENGTFSEKDTIATNYHVNTADFSTMYRAKQVCTLLCPAMLYK
jgi:hypothetical protein